MLEKHPAARPSALSASSAGACPVPPRRGQRRGGRARGVRVARIGDRGVKRGDRQVVGADEEAATAWSACSFDMAST